MDNRLNEIRKKIRTFRGQMQVVEAEMRNDIAHDRDCTAAGARLLAMRRELKVMVEEFKAFGGVESLQTVDERRRQSDRPVPRRRATRLPTKPKAQKRRLVPRIDQCQP